MIKRNITIVSIVVAVIVFIILTFIQNKIINNEPKLIALVASNDIEKDTKLDKEMFREILIPLEMTINTNFIGSINKIEGMFAKEKINKGQVIFLEDIGTEEELKLLEAPNGLEKISIELKSANNAVAYQIKAKDKVNIYFTGRYGAIKESLQDFNFGSLDKSDNSMHTICLLRSTEIIGIYDEVGRSINNSEFSGIDTIVIATDSNMAKLINNLKSQGTFDLTK